MGVQHKPFKRKQYSGEFKREAVRLVTEGGLSIAQVARDLGLNDKMVSRWKKEAQKNGQRAFPGQGHPQDEELSRLWRENEVLRQEREILAISIFSSGPVAGKPVTMKMRYQFIQQHRGQFRMAILLRMLGGAASAFYQWQKRPISQRAQQK